MLVLAVLVLPAIGQCQQDALELLQEYTAALDRGPSLEEGLRYDGAEVELGHELTACEDFGWETHGPTCIAFTRIRAYNTAVMPSLHLSWLRTKLPRKPEIRIVEIQDASQGEWLVQRIRAHFNERVVTFYRDLNMHQQGPFGELHVVDIDGRKAEDLWQEDRNSGFSPTMFVSQDFSKFVDALNWEGVISK